MFRSSNGDLKQPSTDRERIFNELSKDKMVAGNKYMSIDSSSPRVEGTRNGNIYRERSTQLDTDIYYGEQSGHYS